VVGGDVPCDLNRHLLKLVRLQFHAFERVRGDPISDVIFARRG
jgi:hypothetical protein